MPNFQNGRVPNPNYEREDVNQFSQISEFTNDVYIYGTLYADIYGRDIIFDDLTEFTDVLVERNFKVIGLSTFIGPVDMEYLTVHQQFNVGAIGTVFVAISSTSEEEGLVSGRVGIGTTQPAGKFQVGSDCLIVTEDPCAVGIGTTQPDNRFQVGAGDTSFNVTDLGLVGIGNTQPIDKLQINNGTKSVVVTGLGTVGIGTTTAGNFVGLNQGFTGPVSLDVNGPIRVDGHIYDSGESPGVNGYYMNMDLGGIRWIQASPVEQVGILVQDEGVYIPLVGTAQTFSVMNYVQINSLGLGTDTTLPIPDPDNPTMIARIQTQDLWGFTGTGPSASIYRDTKVGIKNPNPTTDLDITGTVHATGAVDFDSTLNVDGDVTFNATLDVDGATTLNSTLDVDGATTLNSTLDVDGATTLNNTLDVDGKTTFNDATDATSTLNASVQMDGGVGIVKKLFVGGQTKIEDATQSTNKDTGALIVDGGVGIEKNLNVGNDAVISGRLDVDSTDNSSDPTTGAAVVDGGVGIGLNLNVGDNTVIGGRLDVDSAVQSSDPTSGAAVIDGGVGIAKNLNVGGDAKIVGDLELEKRIIDFFNEPGVGICKTDYRLSSFDVSGVGIGVSWRPSGVQTKRTIWVTKNGCDTNSGLLEGDAKYTIGAAAAIAQPKDTIRIRSGTYLENNPIGLREDVAVSGEDLRLVLLVPENKNKDFFHVRRGCLIEHLSFTGAALSDDHSNCGAVAFPPTQQAVNAGIDFQAVTGFTDFGPADEGADLRWRSPYIRNCTNFMTKSIGMKINGDYANADASGVNNLGQDLKSMVCDSFTQYNEAGIGVSLSNNAYAQLVSIFTICCDVGIAATSGGQCDLTNSNSSFGNIGLKADGFGDVEFDGILLTDTAGGDDTIISKETQDFNTPSRRFRTPFDGQGAYFHLNMSNYPDTPSTISVTKPLELVRGIRVIDGGSPGQYSAAAPPIITLNQLPRGPEAIIPEFSANVSAAGTITSVDIINSGRNFLPDQTSDDTPSGDPILVNIVGGGGGTDATLEVDMDPILFTVSEATVTTEIAVNGNIGISTIIFNEFIPYPINSGVKVELVRLSRIITSSHSFEYIGAGVDINKANPFQAGKPIPENEVVAINGGQVPFTSTDQKGNFRIGDGLTIDQTTSTIRGRDFNRAIQAQLTPLILALN